jgi:hypothetical protein
VLIALAAVIAGCSVAFPWWGEAPALASSAAGGASVTLGYGGMLRGDTFYMLGPELRNDSSDPVTVISVTATPNAAGVRYVGWKVVRVTEGRVTAFDPARGGRDAQWAANILDVPGPVQTLAPRTDYPDVAIYLAFVIDRDGAYKADRMTVAYVQHGRLRWAHYAVGYRFGTANATPLP